MEQKLFICSCFSPEHQVIFTWDGDDFYLTFHLSEKRFLKRVFLGIKYIFGYKSKYGNFDEIIFKESDKQEIIDLIKKSQKSS